MNIDKSDYYPEPLLPEEPESERPEFMERSEESELSEFSEFSEGSEGSESSEKSEKADNSDNSEQFDDFDRAQYPVVTGIAHFLSWALVPMLMPVYGIILAFGLTMLCFTGFGTRLAFTAITFGFNVVIPAIFILVMKRMGFIKDVGLNNQEERFVPYLVSIFCLVGTALFMGHKGAPMWLEMFFIGGATAGIIEVIINRWWKISVHSAGIAGIVALLIFIMAHEYTMPSAMTWLLISVGLAGLLGASRIWLGRHTLWQVLAGYAVGFCSVFFVMYI